MTWKNYSVIATEYYEGSIILMYPYNQHQDDLEYMGILYPTLYPGQ